MKDVLWNVELPKPETTKEIEIAEKMALYKGSSFDDTYVNGLVEPRIAVEILKLWILYARVIRRTYNIYIDFNFRKLMELNTRLNLSPHIRETSWLILVMSTLICIHVWEVPTTNESSVKP